MSSPTRSRRGLFVGALGLLAGLGLLLMGGCQSSVPRRNPVGEVFPTVTGEALTGSAITLPGPAADRPLLLLVGYEQNAQFDGDRWLLGLMQAETPARIYEVPTIPGLLPGMVAGTIDLGMRKGIPAEDWAVVVTLYGGDASRVEQFTGSESGTTMRVLLLDDQGRVRWFHDRGYSAGKLLELDALARTMN